MGIPAKDERRLKAAHVLVANDEIFQKAVKHMAAMNIAIGIGRSVVKQEFLATVAVLHHLFVKLLFIPFGEHLRLFLSEIPSHLKACFRHQERFFEFFHNSSL